VAAVSADSLVVDPAPESALAHALSKASRLRRALKGFLVMRGVLIGWPTERKAMATTYRVGAIEFYV